MGDRKGALMREQRRLEKTISYDELRMLNCRWMLAVMVQQ